MELIVVLAIGVLLVVFLGSLAALLALCYHRYCRTGTSSWFVSDQGDGDLNPILKYTRERFFAGFGARRHRPNDAAGEADLDGLSRIDDVVQLGPNIAKVLADNDWVYDASGLIHHCLAILKICHQITDRLSALPPPAAPSPPSQAQFGQIREATRRVMPRVEDLVRSMYYCTAAASTSALAAEELTTADGQTAADAHWRRRTPVIIQQAALLEARAAALVMSVRCMTGMFTAAYPDSPLLTNALAPPSTADEDAGASTSTLTAGSSAISDDWLQYALADMDSHLEGLRLASLQEEESLLGDNCRLLFDGGGGEETVNGGVKPVRNGGLVIDMSAAAESPTTSTTAEISPALLNEMTTAAPPGGNSLASTMIALNAVNGSTVTT